MRSIGKIFSLFAILLYSLIALQRESTPFYDQIKSNHFRRIAKTVHLTRVYGIIH